MTPSGLLVIDKPGGITSHGVVSAVRRTLGTRKVGHAGTLDPMATGLLTLGAGSATRLLTYLVGLDKTYETTMRLGAATTTDDAVRAASLCTQYWSIGPGLIEVHDGYGRGQGVVL